MHLRIPSALLLSVLCTSAALAQSPAPGYRLYGELRSTDTHLVDAAGVIVQTWPSTYQAANGVRLMDDGSLYRSVSISCGLATVCGGGIQRVAMDGSLLWEFRYDSPGRLSHHDIEVLPNGNVLLMAFEELSHAQVIAMGRNPALLQGSVFRADHVVEVRPTGPTSGQIVWEWHVLDHLVQDFDPARANYGSVGASVGRMDLNYPPTVESSEDWNHMNGIDYDPIHDWIVLSAHTQDEIWIIDHSTTTAEAATSRGGRYGRGGDFLYRWGNPAAYRRGSAADQMLEGQHAPEFIPPGYPGEGNLMLFNNGTSATGSAAWELELPVDAQGQFLLDANGRYGPMSPAWSYQAPGFFSAFVSSARRLPNGNTLICSGAQAWVFEVTQAGQLVWEDRSFRRPIFHAHYTDQVLWGDRRSLSASQGGALRFDLLSGSSNSGATYLVLGSAAGTLPGIDLGSVLLPLNPDALFLAMATAPNAAPHFQQTAGSLNQVGRAQATLQIAPGSLWLRQPLELHFASLVLDPVTLQARQASAAVAVTIQP
ncbi:MAG: aryl-sulfate sulfotransferase [Planctomycetes bacterium]|nr:aryl-sulfate sulfotransferase [Planctomycetota bacterium]